MQYQIRITSEAENDILDIFDYIAKKDSIESAHYILGNIEQVIYSLESEPERGHHPHELERQGIKAFRQLFFKPYRIIYEIAQQKVIVHIVVDGRREMTRLLERRLLR